MKIYFSVFCEQSFNFIYKTKILLKFFIVFSYLNDLYLNEIRLF